MVIILLLLIVIIAIPICIRRSHYSRLNDRSVTETAHLIAKKVYSEAQEYAAAHGLDLDRDIVSFYVGTQGVSIQYLDGVQQILYSPNMVRFTVTVLIVPSRPRCLLYL